MNRGRPEKLTDDLKAQIAKIRSKCLKLKVPAIRNELKYWLIDEVRKDVEEKQLGWPEKHILSEVEERLPGISRIQKYLKVISPNFSKELELDKPWHLGLMAPSKKHPGYNIPLEAVPYILTVQYWLENYPDWFKNPPPQAPLTIREALWVARLCGMINELQLRKSKYFTSIARFLFAWAKAYATRESICELAEIPFDTTGFDKGLRALGYPITAGKTTVIHYLRDKSFSIDTLDEELLKQMEQMKKEGEK